MESRRNDGGNVRANLSTVPTILLKSWRIVSLTRVFGVLRPLRGAAATSSTDCCGTFVVGRVPRPGVETFMLPTLVKECPGWAHENSPAFQRWDQALRKGRSPVGTTDAPRSFHPSLRDSPNGRWYPSDKSLGYCQMSLRDKGKEVTDSEQEAKNGGQESKDKRTGDALPDSDTPVGRCG